MTRGIARVAFERFDADQITHNCDGCDRHPEDCVCEDEDEVRCGCCEAPLVQGYCGPCEENWTATVRCLGGDTWQVAA